VLGKKDPVLNYEESLEQIENTKVKLVTFPDGHMSYIENRDAVKKTLMDFIKSV
jgi:pimeloyl-ACP methyl ester carboxylesterase